MTVYYVTLGLVGYFLAMAELTQRKAPKSEFTGTPPTVLGRSFMIIASAILIVVAGLRWRVGTDFGGYAKRYQQFQEAFFQDLLTFNEPGIKGLAIVASWLYDDYGTFIFLASLATIGLFLNSLSKYSRTFAFSVCLFVLAGVWHGSFNGVRQYLACAILFAGHRYIVARRPLAFSIIVTCASLFHVSALAMIALYFVPRRRLGILGFLAVFGLVFVALYSSDAVLGVVESVKGSDLTTPYTTREVNPFRIAVGIAPVALYALAVREDDTSEDWFYRNIAVVHAAIVVAVSWSAYLTRFSIFTAAFIPLFLPRLTDFGNPAVTRMVRIGILLLYVVFWHVEVSSSVDLNHFRWVFEREPL